MPPFLYLCPQLSTHWKVSMSSELHKIMIQHLREHFMLFVHFFCLHFAPGLFALTGQGIRLLLRPFHLSQPGVIRPSECRWVRRETADFPAAAVAFSPTSEIEEGSACGRGRTRVTERAASRKSGIAGTCVHRPNVSLNRFLASAPFFFFC